MVTKQNIGSPLTQPIKNIADWTFPLSETLEQYLQEQSRINFTEAALVVQKSTSAYIFRLEDLYNKIILLQQPLEETENEKSHGHCAKKSTMDYNFENLHLVDMEKRIGRNIDIKDDEGDIKEAVKLMSRRFPELEDYDTTHSHPPIYIYDVCREIIGKKYDFRCNHPVDIHGTLVDELIPDVPDSIADASVIERRNSALLSVEVHTPGTVSSGYGSSASISEFQGTNSYSLQDLDTSIGNIDHIESDDLSDDYIPSQTFEETVNKSSNDVSFEQEKENINADKHIEMTPTKRSERVRNMHLISKVTRNAMEAKDACSKSRASIIIPRPIKKAPQKTRKRKHPDSRNEHNACIQSVRDSVKKGLLYEAVEDDRLNLLGFRYSDSADKEVQPIMSDVSRSSTPLHEETRAESMSPDLSTDWDRPDMSCAIPDYQCQIDDKMNEMVQESSIKTEWENAVADWHRSLEPKLLEAEKRSTFDLQGYESEIMSNLKASASNKCDFDHVANDKSVYEISRYFLASLHLANASNIEISHKEGLGMELTLIKDQPK